MQLIVHGSELLLAIHQLLFEAPDFRGLLLRVLGQLLHRRLVPFVEAQLQLHVGGNALQWLLP
jgi:hypothetical protein